MKYYYVYILGCSDGSFYVGISSNLEKRLQEHHMGLDRDAYTFGRRPLVLKWVQAFTTPELAIAFEKQLKGWSKRKKQALIDEDWDRLVLLSKNYTEYGKLGDTEASSTGSD